MVTVSEVRVHKAVAEQEMEQEQSGAGNQTQEPEQEQQQTQQGEGKWITIGIGEDAVTFDLLAIKGIEQYLGTSEVGDGKYTQVRLVIDNVQVRLGDGELQDATLPSNELKIVRPFDVIGGETTALVVDFDADRMVTVTGAGKVIVKPVVKLVVRQEKGKSQQGKEESEEETTEQALVNVSCDDFFSARQISKEVEVNIGDSFEVTLCSNPSTGFQWEEAQISDQTVVEQADHRLISPKAEDDKPPAPGTPGQETWTFKALKVGESTIYIEYSQSWEGGMKAEWAFELTVVVK